MYLCLPAVSLNSRTSTTLIAKDWAAWLYFALNTAFAIMYMVKGHIANTTFTFALVYRERSTEIHTCPQKGAGRKWRLQLFILFLWWFTLMLAHLTRSRVARYRLQIIWKILAALCCSTGAGYSTWSLTIESCGCINKVGQMTFGSTRSICVRPWRKTFGKTHHLSTRKMRHAYDEWNVPCFWELLRLVCKGVSCCGFIRAISCAKNKCWYDSFVQVLRHLSLENAKVRPPNCFFPDRGAISNCVESNAESIP